jgi:two-component system, NtrC family, response regulator AtoC
MTCKTILLVDDEKLIRWSLHQELTKDGFIVIEAESVQDAITKVNDAEPDIVILDQILPDGLGHDFLVHFKDRLTIMPVIMLTAVDRSQTAVQALKLGAFDYITKPVDIEELKIIITNACESSRLRRQVAHLMKKNQTAYGFYGLLGQSPPMKKAFDQISKIAQSGGTTVLITGESGTGKELAARAIHFIGPRREKALITVNFSALTETLVESELFGHEKGAFTDARQQKKGMFEIADGGTIFLDEIGDVSQKIQVKLLRILEQKTFQRVGNANDMTVDVRIIAATNRNLESLVKEEKFRSDFYFRLNVANIHMPPLRDRGDDIILLAEFFLQEFNSTFHKNFKGLSDDTKEMFLKYDWPGNVRELRNVIERATLLDDGEYLYSHQIELGHLNALRAAKPAEISTAAVGNGSLGDMERNAILHALEQTKYNQSQAAKLLKISRDTLRYRMKKYNLLNP